MDSADIITHQLDRLARDIAQSGDWIVYTGQSATRPRRRDSPWTVRLLLETDAGRQEYTSTVQAPDKTLAERRAFEGLNSTPDLLRGREVKSVRTLYAIHQDERYGAMHPARAFPMFPIERRSWHGVDFSEGEALKRYREREAAGQVYKSHDGWSFYSEFPPDITMFLDIDDAIEHAGKLARYGLTHDLPRPE